MIAYLFDFFQSFCLYLECVLYWILFQWKQFFPESQLVISPEPVFDVYLYLYPQICDSHLLLQLNVTQDSVSSLQKLRWTRFIQEDEYFYLGNRNQVFADDKVWKKSNPCFLSIRYICQDADLFIDLIDEYYVEESEILSAEFIRWWLLNHHFSHVPFNETYKLQITTNQLQCFSIGFTESIVLQAEQPFYKVRFR